MSRTMRDSVTAADIPLAGLAIVGGYADGLYRWSPADWARFPGLRQCRTVVNPFTNDGNELDVETGDATPQQAPPWVQMRRRAGVTPTVYMNLATWPQVRQAFRSAGVPEPLYRVAAYDGAAVIPPGAIGKQYLCGDLGCGAYSGGHFDVSIVADYWPGVDPPPAPPAVTPEESEAMETIESSIGRLVFQVTKSGALWVNKWDGHEWLSQVLSVDGSVLSLSAPRLWEDAGGINAVAPAAGGQLWIHAVRNPQTGKWSAGLQQGVQGPV